jgi:OOP family OmpA-OmpF porin
MLSKWLRAGVLVTIVCLAFSAFLSLKNIPSLKADIRAALDNNGIRNIQVEMDGNLAVLSGMAANEAQKATALDIAKNTECFSCNGERRWHTVKDDLSFASLPTQTPYTFNVVKDANGNVTLSGYAPSETGKADVLLAANRIFNTKPIDRKIQIASGAPDERFLEIAEKYMTELARLDKGRFSQEGYDGLISGTSTNVDVRRAINLVGRSLPGDYASGFAANIVVPEMAAENVGEVKSESVCQTLFDDLKSDSRILFETGKANIKGAESFDFLNKLASAANQCGSFRIQIDGYTDSVGEADDNQWLSEARAETVKNYLADQQVEADRMTAKGYGESDPRASNETEEGRALNRRINFTVTRAQ